MIEQESNQEVAAPHQRQEYPTSLLHYDLPPELVPQQPLADRDASRLMVVHRQTADIEHRAFRELPDILEPMDFLVLNDGRVMHSRFRCLRARTGGKVEVLITRVLPGSRAECLTESRGHLQAGDELTLDSQTSFILERPTTHENPGIVHILRNGVPAPEQEIRELLQRGELPLPPYLKERLQDEERYQTTYAASFGSAAAPTAGLHFTPRIFSRLKERGVDWAMVTLHIGTATFLPIRTDDVTDHRLSPEGYSMKPTELRRILKAKLSGRRIVAVGTTSVRVLEGVLTDWRRRLQVHGIKTTRDLEAMNDDQLAEAFPLRGDTRLFILPGYRFGVIDHMLTNFHLPRTTLLALVYAFAGRELIRRAYESAIARRYRFYSLGDSMLIL